MKKSLIFFPFLLALWSKCYSGSSDTLRLFYNIDISTVQNGNIKLDSLLATILQVSETTIFGYTDYLGSANYNLILSQNRADRVKEYLLSAGNKKLTVIVCKGRGEVASSSRNKSKLGEPENRRVDIIVKRSEKKEETKEEEKKVPLEKLNVGDNYILKGLSFVPGRHFIIPESQPVLDSLLETMKSNGNLKIEIQGHICCEMDHPSEGMFYPKNESGIHDGRDQGTGENHLSLNRAKFVYEFLVLYGIDSTRMTYEGFGSSRPKVYPELSADDEQKNRRVEIKIIEK